MTCSQRSLGLTVLAVSLFTRTVARAQALPLYTSPAAALGGQPLRLTSGDVDGDGTADLVARLVNVGGLSLARSLGAAGFAAPQSIGSPFVPVDHVLTDLDGDGDLDIAELGGPGSYRVALYLNDGTGQFLFQNPLLDSFFEPSALHAGDLDADGDVDLVGLYGGDIQTILASRAVWLNQGGLSYSAPQTAPLSTHPSLHALGDVNGDGYLDLAFAPYYANGDPTPPLIVQLGNAAGSFGAEIHSQPFAALALHAQRIALADLDQDGALDLAASNAYGSFVFRAAGDGSGGFAPAQSYFSGASGAGLCVRDLDGDGWLDIVSAQATGTVSAFATLYGGAGGAIAVGAPHGSGLSNPTDVAVGDWNGDGVLDVAVSGQLAGRASIHLGRGARDYADVDFLSLPFNAPRDVECIDWDHDGDLDLAGSNFVQTLALFASDGTGNLAAAQSLPTAGPGLRLSAADLDNGGTVDFVQLDASGGIEVLRSTAAGVFAAAATVASAAVPRDLALADLNLDGRLDLVTSATGGVSWYAGLGGGAFGGPTTIALGLAQGDRIAVADLNLDGVPDVSALLRGSAAIATALASGGGTFAAPVNVSIGTALLDFVAGHLDQDNKFDLVATDAGAQGLWVARNTGNGSFFPATAFAAPSGGETPRLFDANADGFADIVYAEAAQRRPVLALGNGQAQFSAAQALAEGPGLEQLALGDLDADGRCEIIGSGSRIGIWEALSPDPPSTSLFGAGTSGCLGRMGIVASGAPKIGTPNFGLSISNIGAGHGGYLALGYAPDSAGMLLAPFGILTHVDFSAGVQILSAHGSGGPTGRWKAPIPNDSGLIGVGLVFQAAWPWSPLAPCDPSPFLLSTSRGLALTIGS